MDGWKEDQEEVPVPVPVPVAWNGYEDASFIEKFIHIRDFICHRKRTRFTFMLEKLIFPSSSYTTAKTLFLLRTDSLNFKRHSTELVLS